jgi:hypothetical protein
MTERSQLGYVFMIEIMTSRRMQPIAGIRMSGGGRNGLRIRVCRIKAVAMVIIVLAGVS